MPAWFQPVMELAVEADRDGVAELFRFHARPQLSWRDVIELAESGHTPDALDRIIDTCLLPESRTEWAELVGDDEVFLSPTVAQDVARHLVSTAATGRPFDEVCAFVGVTCGPGDMAAYLRGQVIRAGLDDRSPLSAVLDLIMTTQVGSSSELEEWRDRWNTAMRRPRLTVVSAGAEPQVSADGRVWPDRATWGLMPDQVAQTERLMNSAP